MTPQEITEGNRIIAEFMGGYINTDSQQSSNEWIFPDFHTNQLYYHELWDWLMTVVEKIEKIGYWTTIHSRYTIIGTMGQDDCIVNKSGERIEATWLAVIEFIKWHNQQK